MNRKSETFKMDASKVSDYLRRNPEFLNENPDLLSVLVPPTRWRGDGSCNVVDIQTSMLNRMRNETTDLKDAANLLISTTRSNMMIQTRTHSAVLAMLSAKNIEDLIHTVCIDLPLLLDIDAISLCLETDEGNSQRIDCFGIRWLSSGVINKVLGGKKETIRLIEYTKDNSIIFGETSSIVESAALGRMRLGKNMENGLFALGARNRGAFHQDQSTDLFIFVTKVLELMLGKLLPQ